jgi:general secretion pathway protein C
LTMKRYYTLSNILLVIVAVYFTVQAFYKVATVKIDQPDPSTQITKQIAAPADTPSHPLSYYRAIIERNLFNTKTGAGLKPDKIDIEALEPTELKLKLFGTVTGNKKQAYAVIENDETAGTRQDLYRIGDSIGDARVKMILREKVVLWVNDRDEILGIEEADGTQTASRSSRIAARGRSRDITRDITLKRSQIQTELKNVNNLLKQIRIRPHFRGGQPDGLILSGIRPRSIFYNMGLKSGDILTSVDGKKIESVDDALKFYQSLQSAYKVQLELKRRGRTRTIDYRIE